MASIGFAVFIDTERDFYKEKIHIILALLYPKYQQILLYSTIQEDKINFNLYSTGLKYLSLFLFK